LYGSEWAHVSNTPFSHYKGSTYEGGIRSPAIIYWPGQIAAGQTSGALTVITDWYSTFAALAGASTTNPAGKSLVPLLTGDVDSVRQQDETIGLEAWGKRGVIGSQFKLVSSPKKPHGIADWELYDLINDPSEQVDLAAKAPEVSAKMQRQWDEYQSKYNVILPEGPFAVRPVGDIPIE
jgi:arylsulfatase